MNSQTKPRLEPKPPWSAVPRSVRDRVGAILRSPVRRATRAWGGYSPTPTYSLLLKDGRRAFLKATEPASNEFSKAALTREKRVYRELAPLITHWAPATLGEFEVDGWNGLLLEDLGPKSAPPWTPALAKRAAEGLAGFHEATVGRDLPDWVPKADRHPGIGAANWEWMDDASTAALTALVPSDLRSIAGKWLDETVPTLAASTSLITVPPPHPAFLHVDVRSDNLRIVNGRLVLLDWPHVASGPAEFDLALFAQTVEAEEGPAASQVVDWYARRKPVDDELITASAAAGAGFFARNCWNGDVPGLPRLRPFQRRQFQVCLHWAAERLGLPAPTWVDAIPVGYF